MLPTLLTLFAVGGAAHATPPSPATGPDGPGSPFGGLPLAQTPPPAPAPDTGTCGEPNGVVPSFSLVDQNPNSPTYGDTYALDDLLGRVLVIYWAQAS